MNCLYLDIFSGLSGDMFIGAMLDLGVDPHYLETALAGLKLPGYHLHCSRQIRGGIAGTKFDVHIEGEHLHSHDGHSHDPGAAHGHVHGQAEHAHEQEHGAHAHHGQRTFAEIRSLIQHSTLSNWAKQKAVAIFERLAQAEGKIHGQPVEQVHFHEVGALDSIVDIVGACVCLEALGSPKVLAGPVVEGTGTIRCAHGTFPLPAPATLEIFAARGIRLTQCDEPHEMITPTGAALLAQFAETFGPMRNLIPRKIGYGLGSRENENRPNVVRAILASEVVQTALPCETDTVAVLETNLDDINSEVLATVMENALAAGALDVFFTPIQMKKSRPAVMLSVLCEPAEAENLTALLLRETTAFGVRRTIAERQKLRREFRKVITPYGEVTIKLGKLGTEVVQAAPEFESCKAAAAQARVPIKMVYTAAMQAAALERQQNT